VRRGDVLMIGGLLAVLATAAATTPRWARLLARGPQPEARPAGPAPARSGAPAEAEKRINVKLYFEHEQQAALVAEDREIAYSGGLAEQIRTVLEELIKGSQAGHLAALPAETRVLGVFVTPRGTAYVDLSREAVSAQLAGSLSERLAVYALVNSITVNFPSVRRVQILLDDHPAETLSGHVDLSRPLSPDMTLVAEKVLPLEAPPEAAPAEGTPAAAPESPAPSPGSGLVDHPG
jgi:hypothetical protein